MCRLFGQISATPASANDFLAASERSLLVQSYIQPRNRQKDGWGVGYYRGGKAEIVKSAEPLETEKTRFSKLAARLRSKVILGHIRAASNPRGLTKRRLIGVANSQPFTDGRILFAHNGTLQIPDEVASFLGPLRRNLRGVNDSEVYFWQLMKHLDACGDIAQALQACVRETWTLWKGCRARHPGKKFPYTGLNTLVSDGRSLHALCHYPHGTPGACSMFDPRKPWGRMSLGLRGDRVVIASEDMDDGPWKHLADAEIVSVARRGGRWDIRRRRFKPGA